MEGDEENGDNTCRFVGTSVAPRDLMGELVKRSRSPIENAEIEREEEGEFLELSLGLSMNGRFGVDPAMKKIRRSSSVSDVVFGVDCAGNGAERGGHAPLGRTCSLPAGVEKMKNVGGGEGLHGVGDGCFDVKIGHGRFEKLHLEQFAKGAVELRGASQTPTNAGVEIRQIGLVANTDKASVTNPMSDMPYVSTRGFGLNHNKIEGFLYRYKRAEEVKIVCVCHGMFLTPAEFVKHGGGGDVAFPLKHIVVNPFSLC